MPDSLPPVSRSSHTVRKITALDLPWMMSLAYARYGAYDPGKILTYLLNGMQNPEQLLLRTDDAFVVAATLLSSWGTERHCHIVAFCAAPGAHWQGVPLLRESIAWARANGCRKWWFSSETHHQIDAFAKRVGAKVSSPRYAVEL